jgi:polyhydroxyalkanoate synthesis regulator phasin
MAGRDLSAELFGPEGGAGRDLSSDLFPKQAPAKDAGFSLRDLAASFGIGALGSTKALTDVAGAENILSEKLGAGVEGIQRVMTPERQAEMERQAARMKAAEESGSTLQEIKAGALNVAEAPLQSAAQAIGSFVPYLLSTPVAAGMRLTGASKAAIEAVSKQAPKVIATAQGAGAVKGAIYDGVLRAEIEAGVDPEIAKQKADAAQSYFGGNIEQIALGAGLGFAAGSSGVEKFLTPAGRVGAAQNMGRRVGEAVVKESLPEAAQGGQERLAQNIALQREGYDVDTFSGVAGAATQEALTGALGAAPIAALVRPEVRPPESVDTFKKEEEEFRKQFGKAEPVAPTIESTEPPTEFPGGYVATPREISRQEVPESYGIFPKGSDQPLTTVSSPEDAEKKIQSLTEIRQQEQERLMQEGDKIMKPIEQARRQLEVMEATGKAGTDEYVQAKALLSQQEQEADDKFAEIFAQINSYAAPLTIAPVGTRTQVQREYVVSRGDEPVGAFSSLEEAAATLKNLEPELFKQAEEEARVKTDDRVQQLKQTLMPTLQKFGLQDVGLNVVDRIENDAGGRYLDSLIDISLTEQNPLQTLRHESLHALKDLEFFTPQQWKALEERANKQWIKEYLQDQTSEIEVDGKPVQMSRLDAYKRLGYSQEAIVEEAIADAFGAYARGATPPPGMIAALFKKLQNFFTNFGQALRGAGFESADDVFQRVERGELKSRKAKTPSAEKLSLPIMRGEEVAKFEGPAKEGETEPTKLKPTVDLIGKYFDDQVKERSGSKLNYSDKQSFDSAVKAATDEVKYQMAQEKSGLNWYEDDIKEAFKLTKKFIPELGKTDNRLLFSVIAGIMSPQTTARDNWFIAAKAYEHYRATKDIPGNNPETGGLWQGGTQSPNKKIQLEFLDRMVKDMGQKKALEWLFNDHTVKEINQFRQKYGNIKSGIDGKLTDMKPGLYAFGPKVGPFVSNLNGIHDVTVDKWMTRTFNRYFGAMLGPDQKIVDAPTEPQRRAVKALVNEVAKNAGIKPYQVQSLLWFYEQQLFTKMGALSPSYGFSDGGRKFAEARGRSGAPSVSPATEAAEGKLKEKKAGEANEATRPKQPAVRPSPKGKLSIKQGGERRGGGEPREIAPLEGAPSVPGFSGPIPEIVATAERYAKENGIPYKRQAAYVKADPERAARIAQAYEEMPHAPQDPEVQKAYKDLIRQTTAQYEALLDSGYDFWFLDMSKPDNQKYASSPWNALRDLKDNKQMGVFPTNDGFGSGEDFNPEANPLLADTGFKWPTGGPDGPMQPVLANDLFRAVHDAFGHGIEGAGFRADGEENAWQAHVRLFTGPAVGAITSETRGQNSWLNYGPSGEQNRTAKVEDTVFADQKTGLMPNWTWEEGLADDEGLVLGTKQPDAISVNGAHYGMARVSELDASKYGTGLRGAERRRLDQTDDERIKRRAYFYIAKPDGSTPTPESGVGQYVYTQKFDNILGSGPTMSRLYREANGDSNNFESLIVDAGYDGYAVPSMGMMVILNNNVPVNYVGPRSEVGVAKLSLKNVGFPSVKAAKEAVKNAGVPDTAEFKQFIAGNQWNDADGKPMKFYHATAREFFEFTPAGQSQAIFLATTPEEAETFGSIAEDNLRKEIYEKLLNKEEKLNLFQKVVDAEVKKGSMTAKQGEQFMRQVDRKAPKYGDFGDIEQEMYDALLDLSPTRMSIMPLYARAETPFDFENKEQLDQVMEWFKNNASYPQEFAEKWVDSFKGRVAQGLWQAIEDKRFQQALKALGYDGFTVREGRNGPKNYAVYKPEQVKSITGNLGDFSREAKDIRYSLPTIPQNLQDRIGETTSRRERKTVIQNIVDAIRPTSAADFRAKYLNRYNQMSVYDKKLAEQMGGAALLADQSAESAALMSDLGAGVAASAMGFDDRNGGIPVLRNGITTIDKSVKGLIASLAPLAERGDPAVYQRYQYWAMVKRGQRLNKEGKLTGIDSADVAFAKFLEQKHPEFVSVQKDLIAFNNGLVKYMVDTGVLSQERGQMYTKYADYIPFYRQMDGDTTLGPNLFQSLSGVKPPKKLKGADAAEAPLADFLETMVRNTQSSIQAGIKNYAAQRAVGVATQLKAPGMGAERLNTKENGPNIINVLEKGNLVSYRTPDPLLVNAMMSLNQSELPFIGFLSAPADLLRNLVTKEPGFMMANMMRDSLSAWVTSGQKMTPIAGTVINFGKGLARKSPGFEAMLDAGIIGGYEFNENIEKSGFKLEDDLSKKAGKKDPILLRPFTSVWDALGKGTTASDAATRALIYERVLADTGNEAEALYRSLEVMNFHRKGSSPLIRVLTAAVPFFNARLQGLDLFYRASTGNMNNKDAASIQRQFFMRGMTMMALSGLYWMLVSDDEEYKKQEQETRDNNWIIPAIGVKIPIPFEVGVLFKVIPERIMAYTFGNDTGEDLKKSMIRNAVATFAFNPTPQTVKPLLEAYVDYNMFTMRPILGQGMKDIEPEFQVGPSTSNFAKMLAQNLGLSPIKVDHIIKGYTGTIGMYAIDTIDMVLDQFGDSPKPTKRFEQLPVIKRFASDPEARGFVTQYYELKDAVDTTVRTMNLLENTGQFESYMDYLVKNQGTLAFKDYVNDTERTMKELREMRTAVRSSTMSGDEKRDALLEISRIESSITSNIQDVKKAIAKVQ